MSRFARLLIALFFSVQPCILSQSKPLELKWNELAPLIAGQKVELHLTDGSRLKGEAVAVREDTLVMDVHKSSGATRFEKGNGTVSRDKLNLIKLERQRGAWGRSIGTVIGVMAGLIVGGYAAVHTGSPGPAVATLIAIGSGMSVAGYYAGRELDRKITVIKVVP